jgi:large subunit ribosomal protein L24
MSRIKTHVKKGDEVKVTVGGVKIKRKTGKVLSVNAEKGTVIVEGVRMIKKATKPTEANPNGGIIEVEGPIHISNVRKVG